MWQLLLSSTGCHGLWAGAVAMPERNGLAVSVGLALETRISLCLYAALQMLKDDVPTLYQGVPSMRCCMWQDHMVLMSRTCA